MAIGYNKHFRWFVVRPWTTGILVVANLAAYVYAIQGCDCLTPRTNTLIQLGAYTQTTLADHAYWRLFAAGFLHLSPAHLTSNMLCLLIWGSLLEKRIGSLYFAALYALCLFAGSLTSVALAHGPFVAVGASGAISGVFGGLIALTILGRIELSAGFIIPNILINILLAVKDPTIDWRAHLGGLTAGLVGCALLDQITKAGAVVFRCKFPEFVKINATFLVGLCLALAWRAGLDHMTTNVFAKVSIAAAGIVLFLKAIDLILAARKGLLIVCALFAMLNTGAAAALAQSEMGAWLASGATLLAFRERLAPGLDFDRLHIWPPLAPLPLLCVVVFAATCLAYLSPILRGLRDVGFTGAALMAQQKRSDGL